MDKYPELDEEFAAGSEQQGDFLSREREALGEDAAEFGATASGAVSDVEGDEEAEFQSNYPALDADSNAGDAAAESASGTAANGSTASLASANGSGAGTRATTPDVSQLGESEFLKEWKVKHELEVERRDKASAEKQAETREKAKKAIDDFYQNHNSKLEKGQASIEAEATEFVKTREASLGGSTWKQVSQLIDGATKPAAGIKPADKTRFKELIDSLKDDANAPGAAGY